MTSKEMWEELGFGVRRTNKEIIVENSLEKYTFDFELEMMFIDNKAELTHHLYLTKYVSKAIQKTIEELGW